VTVDPIEAVPARFAGRVLYLSDTRVVRGGRSCVLRPVVSSGHARHGERNVLAWGGHGFRLALSLPCNESLPVVQ